jgi:hypothetical protein
LLTIYVIFAAVHMRKVCQGSILKVEDDIICHCVRTCNDKKSISEKKKKTEIAIICKKFLSYLHF